MRQVSTQTVSIRADYDTAFAYISNPLTQKEWAINFVKDVRQKGKGFVVETPFGEAPLEIRSDKQTGVIDIFMGDGNPTPTRLVKNDDGVEYLFTLLKPDNMPQPAWENEGIPGLIEELQTLKAILEG